MTSSETLEHRRQFLFENQFEKQDDIDYIHPNQNQNATKVDLFIKANIELTKDIYGTSVKSNYILKYVLQTAFQEKLFTLS